MKLVILNKYFTSPITLHAYSKFSLETKAETFEPGKTYDLDNMTGDFEDFIYNKTKEFPRQFRSFDYSQTEYEKLTNKHVIFQQKSCNCPANKQSIQIPYLIEVEVKK